MTTRDMQAGEVWIVGAGPGDPDLLTLKAARCLRSADVVVYDRLASSALLELTSPTCEHIYAGKRKNLHVLPQERIHDVLIDRARRGLRVVRLKGGDPLIFGRGGEEIEALTMAGIAIEVVPGITSALAAAAGAQIALTHRDYAQAVTLVTAHRRNGQVDMDWELIARPGQTVVIYMGLSVVEDIVRELLRRSFAPDTPFSIVANASKPEQQVLHATLATVLENPEWRTLPSPALLMLYANRARSVVRASPDESRQVANFA